MVICPNCLHKNMVGAVFCSECGMQITLGERQKTGGVQITTGFKSGSKPGKSSPSAQFLSNPYPDAPVTLLILNSETFLPISGEGEVILGRASEGQSMLPDINLDPYHAYEAGVSRIHAAIRVINDQIILTDLDSGNGTLINGKKIEAQSSHPIKHGDIVSLGKFRIQIITPKKQTSSS